MSSDLRETNREECRREIFENFHGEDLSRDGVDLAVFDAGIEAAFILAAEEFAQRRLEHRAR